MVPTTTARTWWNSPKDHSSGKLESTHPSRTSIKYDQGFLVLTQSCVSTLPHYTSELLLPTTSTSGTLNDLTTDLIMANNNNNMKYSYFA